MGIRSLVKQILIQKENKRYEKLLATQQMTYEQWLLQAEEKEARANRPETLGQSENFAKDVKKKDDNICYIISSHGEFSRNARERIADYFRAHSESLLLYGDEDVMEAGERKCPWFKPDWSPDLLDSYFYFGSVVALRGELLEQVENVCKEYYGGRGIDAFAKERQDTDCTIVGCRIYDVSDFAAYEKWIHLCLVAAKAYQRDSRAVGHLSGIIFHCYKEEMQRKYLETSDYLQECREEQVHDFREARTIKSYRCIVSVIIPSKDHPAILEQCIRSCRKSLCIEENKDISCEILVVDNGSSEENRGRIQGMIEELTQPRLPITYIYEPMEFHFSAMCNLGASRAKGDFLLFLNDDVELCVPGCITQMAALADRNYTGAVGMKLYYPESRRIQHAGITNLPMGPVHKLQFLEDNICYYYNSNRGLHNMTAVTAACLMVEKAKFDEVGGFSSELPIAFNDVDLCFSLFERGYHNVCMNDIYACHHESLSRGDDESAEKLQRLLTERDKLYERHPGMRDFDPYYSVYLNREGLDTRIRPAYETSKNCVQRVVGKPSEEKLGSYRSDNCVLLRVESLQDGILHGYCVILGDNNACYEKRIALIPTDNPDECDSSPGEAFCISIKGQYRPDLVANMPDQVNVGLCGFWIDLSEITLPHGECLSGEYRIGVAVQNRVTGLRLRNNSNCYFKKGVKKG